LLDEHLLLSGWLGVAAQNEGSSIGGREVDVEHLDRRLDLDQLDVEIPQLGRIYVAQITPLNCVIGAKLRGRSRSVGWRLIEISRSARGKTPASQDKIKRAYGKLLEATGRVVGQATEFGEMVKMQEAENQIVIDYQVYPKRPSDHELLIPAIEAHEPTLGRVPHLVAADAGFYSAKNEPAAKAKGVKRVCVPNRASKSATRKGEQKKRWSRNGQNWRTGCEGRISVSARGGHFAPESS